MKILLLLSILLVSCKTQDDGVAPAPVTMAPKSRVYDAALLVASGSGTLGTKTSGTGASNSGTLDAGTLDATSDPTLLLDAATKDGLPDKLSRRIRNQLRLRHGPVIHFEKTLLIDKEDGSKTIFGFYPVSVIETCSQRGKAKKAECLDSYRKPWPYDTADCTLRRVVRADVLAKSTTMQISEDVPLPGACTGTMKEAMKYQDFDGDGHPELLLFVWETEHSLCMGCDPEEYEPEDDERMWLLREDLSIQLERVRQLASNNNSGMANEGFGSRASFVENKDKSGKDMHIDYVESHGCDVDGWGIPIACEGKSCRSGCEDSIIGSKRLLTYEPERDSYGHTPPTNQSP